MPASFITCATGQQCSVVFRQGRPLSQIAGVFAGGSFTSFLSYYITTPGM